MNEASSDRWSHIRRALHVDSAGNVDDDFIGWWWHIGDKLSPADRAAAYEQWADFYEYRLAQRAGELAGDHSLRRVVEVWTDSMAYCCRRSAAWARDEDPGQAIPQHERRPDLTHVVHLDTPMCCVSTGLVRQGQVRCCTSARRVSPGPPWRAETPDMAC